MAVKQIRYFKVSGSNVNGYSATASFNTDSVNLTTYDGAWLVQVSRSLATGTPRVTIQCSEDGSNWVNYNSLSTSLTIPCVVEQSNYRPNYMRVVYTIGGSPTGTITMWYKQIID